VRRNITVLSSVPPVNRDETAINLEGLHYLALAAVLAVILVGVLAGITRSS
jgi:hypothetical protein